MIDPDQKEALRELQDQATAEEAAKIALNPSIGEYIGPHSCQSKQ
jgi:hypothetical protein